MMNVRLFNRLKLIIYWDKVQAQYWGLSWCKTMCGWWSTPIDIWETFPGLFAHVQVKESILRYQSTTPALKYLHTPGVHSTLLQEWVNGVVNQLIMIQRVTYLHKWVNKWINIYSVNKEIRFRILSFVVECLSFGFVFTAFEYDIRR